MSIHGTDSEIRVNGLPLPPLLVEMLETGRWKPPQNSSRLRELLDWKRIDNAFLNIEGMERETAAGHRLYEHGYADLYGLDSSKRKGVSEVEDTFLDVDKSVLIAMNYDEEGIFLDYRRNPDNPSVVASFDYDNGRFRYKTISPDFFSFVELLGL